MLHRKQSLMSKSSFMLHRMAPEPHKTLAGHLQGVQKQETIALKQLQPTFKLCINILQIIINAYLLSDKADMLSLKS